MPIVAYVLLVLGLVNPVKNNPQDLFLSFFIFGFSSYLVISSSAFLLPFVASTLITTLIIIFLELSTGSIFGTIFGLLAAYLMNWARLRKYAIFALITIFLISSYAVSKDSRNFLSADLHFFTYNNDPGVFYKTYLQLESRVDYYEAFKNAMISRFDRKIIPQDIWGWRLPTIFYIWKFLPGSTGLSIYFFYLILAGILLYAAFQIGKKYLGENLGFLSAYLLYPYLHFAARDQMLLETEWWSVSLFIVALYFLIAKRAFISTILFSLTVLIREVYLLPVFLIFIYFFIKERKQSIVFLIPLVSFVIFYLYHIYRVSTYINALGTLLSSRTTTSGTFFVQQTLSFASWEYLFFRLRPFIIFLLLSIVGCFLLYRTKFRKDSIIWLLSFLPFPIAFLKFGTVPYNDYWGIIYMPLVLILTPLSLLWLIDPLHISAKK